MKMLKLLFILSFFLARTQEEGFQFLDKVKREVIPFQLINNLNAVQYKFTLKPEYSVSGVRGDSPAQKAGIRKGDRFILINGRKAGDMNLQEIYDLMKSEEGKEMSLEMKRKQISLRFRIILEDPIPYIDKQ